MANFDELSRREIQALCKEHGIKAGGKTADLIESLSAKLSCSGTASDGAVSETSYSEDILAASAQQTDDTNSGEDVAVSETKEQPASVTPQAEAVAPLDGITASVEESDTLSKPEVRVPNRRKSRASVFTENEEPLPLPPSPSTHSKGFKYEVSETVAADILEPLVKSPEVAAASKVIEEPNLALPTTSSSNPAVPQNVLEEVNTEKTAVDSPVSSIAAVASATKENDTSAVTKFTGFSQETRENRSEALGAKRKFVGRAPTSNAMYDSAGHRIAGATPTSSAKSAGKKKDRLSSFSVQKSSTPSTEVRPFNLSSSNRSENAQNAPCSARAALEKKPHVHVKATKTSQLREQRLAKIKQDQKKNRKALVAMNRA